MTEAEQGVIGCVLIDNDSMFKVYNKLKPEMFSTEFCQDAFAEMLAMYDRVKTSISFRCLSHLKTTNGSRK